MVVKKLIVDEHHDVFNTEGMERAEYSSDYSKVREYALEIADHAPAPFREGNLLEQQISEIVKNAIKHGNQSDGNKKIRVWYSFHKGARFICEDEGNGFHDLDKWNEFYKKRQEALAEQDFDKFLRMAAYSGLTSDDTDGGNSLIAAIEYWNGGIIYNKQKNKVGAIRWFDDGSRVE